MSSEQFWKLINQVAAKGDDEPLTNDELEAMFTYCFGNAFEEEPFAEFQYGEVTL